MTPHRPTPRVPRRPARLLPGVAAFVGAALASACDVPNFQGPQIQNPPPAFTMNREAAEERPMFPDRAVLYHDAWVEASWGNFSGIYINGHPGVLGSDEVDAARRQAMAATAGRRVTYGELESLQVDGRTAWGWGEAWTLENGGLQYVVFRAAVPYDTITYSISFLTGEPGLKSRPDSLRTIVASFAVGRTTLDWPVILIVSGVVLFVFGLWRRRAKERAARHRQVPLAKLPKKDAAKPGNPAPAPPPASPPSGSIAGQIEAQLSQKKPPPKA